MGITSESLGRHASGKNVVLYQLSTEKARVTVSNLGGILQSFLVKDRHGIEQDILLGYDTVEGLSEDAGHMGALVGRNANRIAGGRFFLRGREITLPCNDHGYNNLHSGPDCLRGRFFTLEERDGAVPELYCHTILRDGEQGFPGEMRLTVGYRLEGSTLTLHYTAVSDRDTVANFTNHAYFNLSGNPKQGLRGHWMKLYADYYTPIDEKLIPTGEIREVSGSDFDFREERELSSVFSSEDVQLRMCRGLDHNFCLSRAKGRERPGAELRCEESGIRLRMTTDLPGVQVYTANSLRSRLPGKHGAAFHAREGFCLETQYYPDAVHHENFASPVLSAGEHYESTTRYELSCQ